MKHLLWLLVISFPLFAQPEFDKGEKLFLEGRFQHAKVILEPFAEKNPKHLKTLEYLGDIHGRDSNWEEALKYYEQLRQLRPQVANYHYKVGGVLGMIAKESNKFRAVTMIDDIRESFEKAIALDAKHIEARWALIELYLQLPAIVGGSESKANKYAAELLQLSPVDGHLAKGHIAEYFRRYLTAEKNYKNAISIGHSRTTYEKLASLYRNKMNQPEKAKALMADYKKNAQSGKA